MQLPLQNCPSSIRTILFRFFCKCSLPRWSNCEGCTKFVTYPIYYTLVVTDLCDNQAFLLLSNCSFAHAKAGSRYSKPKGDALEQSSCWDTRQEIVCVCQCSMALAVTFTERQLLTWSQSMHRLLDVPI